MKIRVYEPKHKSQSNKLFRNVFYIENGIQMNREGEKIDINVLFDHEMKKNVIFPRNKPMANKNISFLVSLLRYVELQLCFYLFYPQICIVAHKTQKVLNCDETSR